jgi:hypothetical protein
MDQDRRKGDIPVPDNLEEVLNVAQLRALSGIIYSGWMPRYLRRPMFQEPVLILLHPEEGRIAILETDGSLKTQTGIKLRPV